MMLEQITQDQFMAKTPEEQSIYIQQQLHLSYYRLLDRDCSPEEAERGKRLIGFVLPYTRDSGQSVYYVHPIDCLNGGEEFRRGALFKDSLYGFPLLKNDRESLAAVAEACRETIHGRGKQMVSGEYVLMGHKPVQLTKVRVLDVTQKEMQELIRTTSDHRIELETSLEGLEQQREDLEQQLKTVNASLKEAQANLTQVRQSQQGEIEQLEKAQNAAKALTQKVRKLADDMLALGFDLDMNALGLDLEPPPAEDEQLLPQEEPILDLSGLVKQTQGFLSQECGLYYERHIIREFLGAMFSNQIIILSGPPGTGKSSLSPAIAGYIGAQCRMVSVQPSWTDNQDLLGFYDPTQKRFIATPFMEILVEAANDPQTIYLVCLDEMNLVRVEYYFSEILSAMEARGKELRLYSPHAYELHAKALKRKISPLLKQMPLLSGQERWEAAEKLDALLEAQEVLLRYKAAFPIPNNVQFVGTLNMDESTKELSPKVLDRSFIIEVGRAAVPPKPAEQENFTKGIYAPAAFQNMQGGLPEAELITQMDGLKGLLRQIENLGGSQQASASLSWRGESQVRKLLSRGLKPDDVFLGKIMPALKYAGLDRDRLAEQMRAHQPELTNSLKKLALMYDPEIQELNYW